MDTFILGKYCGLGILHQLLERTHFIKGWFNIQDRGGLDKMWF